jgi:hypothetical protein
LQAEADATRWPDVVATPCVSPVVLGAAVPVEGGRNRFQQILLINRFPEKIDGARLEGLDTYRNRAMAAEKDDGETPLCGA